MLRIRRHIPPGPFFARALPASILLLAVLLSAGCAGDPAESSLLPGRGPLLVGSSHWTGVSFYTAGSWGERVVMPRPGRVTTLGLVHNNNGGTAEINLFAADGSGALTGLPLTGTGPVALSAGAVQPVVAELPVPPYAVGGGQTYWIVVTLHTGTELYYHGDEPGARCSGSADVTPTDGITNCTLQPNSYWPFFLLLE